ncbi:MAG TPA: hypothetical protein VE263_01985 [Candidatus Angelobacter sp.]|nr:hypothetical protein [Candidatus Angelobacter sp.]
MKPKRWFTPAGSIVLFATAIYHASVYIPVLRRMRAAGIGAPFDGMFKASWWILSTELAGLGVIALLAHQLAHGGGKLGGRIVLVCAATSAFTAVLLACFLGLFSGVYLLALVTVLLLLGGWQQTNAKASP